MKKILIILFSLITVAGFSQVTPFNRGSSSILARDARVQGYYNLVMPVGIDTTLNGGLDSLGSLIFNKLTRTVYFRDTIDGGHVWTAFGSGGGGGNQDFQGVIDVKHVTRRDNLITMPDFGIDWISGDTLLAGAYSNLHIFPDGTSNLTRSDASHYGRIVTTPVSASISNQNSIDRVTWSIDGTNDAILPKVLLTGIPTGAGYVLTDVPGNGTLSLEPPSGGGGGTQSWDSTMRVSPDLLQDYGSNFHNKSWAIDSINSLQFDAYSFGGENFRSQYFQPGYEVRYNLYNENTSNLISSFLIDKSSLAGALFDSTNGNEINSITLSAVDSSIYLKTASNKIKMDLDSVGSPINSLWIDAAKHVHIGAISSGSTNSNIGAGYRWAIPNTNNIKTAFGGFAITLDSTTNTNGLTFKVDTSTTGIHTENYYNTKYIYTGSNGITLSANDFKWGGALSQNTTIAGAGFYSAFNGGRLESGMGASVAAANNLTLGSDGNTFSITGATQINAITTANWQAGSVVNLVFTSTPTVKNNTAGGAGTAVILLSSSADFTAAANDVLTIVYDGTSWHETSRKQATVGGQFWALANGGILTGVNNITNTAISGLNWHNVATFTANNQFLEGSSGTATARATVGDVFTVHKIYDTLVWTANTQEGILYDFAPTFTTGAFTLPEQTIIRSKGNINPVGSGLWNLGRTLNMWAGVYANRWFGTIWDANGANSLQINLNGYRPMSVIAATQNIKFGSITTTTVDSLRKVDINGDLKVSGGIAIAQLPTPVITSITNQGTAGATTYTYVLIYRDVEGNVSGASAPVTTTTGNATLSPTNFNRINFSGAETAGLTAYYHDLYRTVGGATQGKVATSAGYALTSTDDIGSAGDGTTAPANNNSGNIGVGILRPTAGIDIRAGVADVGGAQIKFRNSVLTTTPEPGAMSHKDGLWYIDSSASVRDTIAGRGWTRANITGVTTATASTLMARDANANASVNNTNFGYTTTATAAGTTTLTVGSTLLQYFTGSTTQTVVMPVASTLVLGQRYIVVNNSTGLVTVQSSGANSIVVIPASGSATLTCILTSGTTAASWASNVSSSIYIDAGWQTYTGDTWDGTAPTTSVSRQYRWIQSGKGVQLWITLNYSGAGVSNTNLDLAWPADVPLPQEPAGRTATNDVEYIGTGRMAISTSSATANVKAAFIIKTGTLTYKGNVSSASISAKTADYYVSYPTP